MGGYLSYEGSVPEAQVGRWSLGKDFTFSSDSYRSSNDLADVFQPYLDKNTSIKHFGLVLKDGEKKIENEESLLSDPNDIEWGLMPWITPRFCESRDFLAYLDYYATCYSRKPILLTPRYFIFLLLMCSHGFPAPLADCCIKKPRPCFIKEIQRILEEKEIFVDGEKTIGRCLPFSHFRLKLPIGRDEFELALAALPADAQNETKLPVLPPKYLRDCTASVPLITFLRGGRRNEWSNVYAWVQKNQSQFFSIASSSQSSIETFFGLMRLAWLMNYTPWNDVDGDVIRSPIIPFHAPLSSVHFSTDPDDPKKEYGLMLMGESFRDHRNYVEPVLRWCILKREESVEEDEVPTPD